MYAIIGIGLLTIFLSVIMAVSPEKWSRGILSFAEKSYFHIFEITTRIALGAVLLFFANETLFPLVMKIVGGIFVFAGVFLIIIGSKRHREFAVRSSTFVKVFRPAGIFGIAAGVFAIYAAIG
jgi:sulfite exporter TauE/SafE